MTGSSEVVNGATQKVLKQISHGKYSAHYFVKIWIPGNLRFECLGNIPNIQKTKSNVYWNKLVPRAGRWERQDMLG